MLPQNPQSLFVKKTVEEDLWEMLTDRKDLTKEEKAQKVAEVAELVDISDLLAQHPYDISGGEQQRAALAKVLLIEPRSCFWMNLPRVWIITLNLSLH